PPSEVHRGEVDLRFRLRRGPKGTSVHPMMPAFPAATPAPAPASPTPPAAVERAPSKPLIEIKSPTPGTFYAAGSPDAPPFVQVGSRVTNTTVVGVIEAMKIFNEIQAECAGVIVEINLETQQPVEY